MAELIDDIIKDLIASDESLATDEPALRQVILAMQKSKPDLKLDDNFKARLRQDLVGRVDTKKPIVSLFPWWTIYAAPLGVTLLLFMLIQPNEMPLTPTQVEESIEMAPMMYSAPGGEMESRMMKDAQIGTEEIVHDALMSSPVSGSDVFGVNFLEDGLGLVVSYFEVSQPAFVVVKDDQGEIVAVSEILMPGVTTEISVQLFKPLDKGYVYHTYLYYDNGDLEFRVNSDTDSLRLDNGEPLTIPIIP